MPDLFNETNQDDVLNSAEQDSNIDLSQFIKTKKNDEPDTDIHTSEVSEEKNTNTTNEKSPLEREMERRKSQQRGISMTKEEFEKSNAPKQIRSFAENDERIQTMIEAQEDSDLMLKKRAAVVPLIAFNDQTEYVQIIDEISHVSFDENGKAYFKKDRDSDGNEIPFSPKYIRLRTENDPPFSRENDYKILMKANNISDESTESKTNSTSTENTSISSTPDTRKQDTVQIIIDKTGLGTNISFTDEERRKMAEANEIRLTQVEVLDIASIKTVKPERKSFTGKIHEHTLSGSKTTISFPASGFRADMTGLTYGEIGDISLSMESVTTDKYYKRLSTVYNKMKNITCGPFDSFEDFLKNLAYTDIPLAIYGLYVSSFPEIQTIALRCGHSACNKTFDFNFSTRNILRLEKSDQVLLDHMANLAAADPDDFDELYKNAPVRNSKFLKLPYSGYIVECGIASAYEFLYNFIPVLDESTFKNAFGDDLNQVYMNNVLLLTSVLSVRVPDKNNPGTYILCEGYKDILDAIYNIGPEEIKIIAGIAAKIQREYQVNFSFGDVTCPHCKHVTRDMDLTIDDLVFQTYQRLLNTEVNLENIRGL